MKSADPGSAREPTRSRPAASDLALEDTKLWTAYVFESVGRESVKDGHGDDSPERRSQLSSVTEVSPRRSRMALRRNLLKLVCAEAWK